MREVFMSRHIVILGAGITGLALGWFLKRDFGSKIKITILEKSNRSGGWIESIEKNGFLFDLGPRSCRSGGNGITTLKLIEELNLQNEVIVAARSAHQRYLYRGQRLQKLPSNLLAMLFSPLTRGLWPALYRDWRTPSIDVEDESIYAFMSRRFSKELAEQFMDPLVSGIYAGDIHRLSLKSCFPLLHQWEQSHGSVVRGMMFAKKKIEEPCSAFVKKMKNHALFSFQKGMETLPRHLEKHLQGEIQFKSCVTALDFMGKGVNVQLLDGSLLHADHVYSTISSEALASLVRPHHPKLADSLSSIFSTSVAVVNVGYRKKVLQEMGFGYLIPSLEKENILGVVWDSCVFPQQNQFKAQTRLTVMIGGAHLSDFQQFTPNDFLEMALKALKKHLLIDENPDVTCVKIASAAIPQYVLGHEKRLSYIKNEMAQLSSHITSLGSSYSGVSVNDCIAQAERASWQALSNFR